MRDLVERILALAAPNARATAAEFLQALRNQRIPDQGMLPGSWYSPALRKAVAELFGQVDLSADMALQAVMLCGDLIRRQGRVWVQPDALEHLQRWWASHGKSCDLAGFARLWEQWGGRSEDFLLAFGDERWGRLWPQLEDAFCEDYVRLQQRHLLEGDRWTCLRLLIRLEPMPEPVLQRVWESALEEPRKERELAQAFLQSKGLAEQGLLKALRHGQAAVRQRAAEWAGRTRLVSALKPLGEALAKEKSDRARMAQMEALRLLGAPLDLYLNRPAMLAEAVKRLRKEQPEWLAGLPLSPLRWLADSQPVATELQKAWALAAVRLKQPEPAGLLAVVAPFLDTQGREQWGLELLSWWIAQDTRPTYTPAQVDRLWPQQANALKNLYVLLKQPKSDQALESEARRNLELSVEGSAIELKGLLAVAGAFGGARLLEPVRAYLKKWYGMRAAQCKALLAMLGYVEGASVVQFLLEVGRRFRTKGIQQEAQRVLRERAERAGWTVEELADLSLPTGGLDERGQLQLELGGREFSASLQPDLSWRLCDASGKVLKSLPASDEKEPAALFKAAQKTVKEVQKSLRDRLYEAMCCGRPWSFQAWETCLRRHPIAARIVQSLVWTASREGERISFRPDLDGSLLSAEQDSLALGASWTLELAHPLLLSNAELSAWHRHIADYLLLPPFAQLSRPIFTKPPSELEEIPWRGHMLNSFKLRSRAQALGYVRAPAQDGGVFDEYHKSLVSSGWTVRIGFTGSALPETSHPVALQSLSFELKNVPARWSDIPPLLYCEAMADLEEIAREGSGFDPDWLRKASIS